MYSNKKKTITLIFKNLTSNNGTIMAALSEAQQMRLAIEASLRDMQVAPAASRVGTAGSTAGIIATGAVGAVGAAVGAAAAAARATSSSSSTLAAGKPAKKGKKRILRLIHKDGLHRLKKFDFDAETVLMLKQRVIRSMELAGVEPSQITVKLDRDADRYFGGADDSKTLPEIGIEKNGQKIWVAFPQAKLATLAPYLGTSFLRGSGSCGPESLQAAKVIGIYFSAHWCGPCRAFTPQLVTAYNSLKKAGAPVEIIFVSCDRDEASMKSYFATMPWLAFPLRDDRGSMLNDKFSVRGIPNLVFVDTGGKVLTTSGREVISRDPSGQGVLKLVN